MPTAFEKLIERLPHNSEVLDIGCGGLSGENTSDFLITKFSESNVVGLCKDGLEVKQYQELHPNLKIVIDDYNTTSFIGLFDLVVHDLNIENNIRLWENLDIVKKYIKPGGYLITYIMATTDYGDKDTPALITEHWDTFWQGDVGNLEVIGKKLKSLPGYECIDLAQEGRRPYIYWVLLKDNG